jgi:catechol 2,3-dioxygenase-like lactoylglutathione lyase family enzyme
MRLNQITAAARDLDASIAFYATLGLRLIVKSQHYARFELPEGEATFSLHLAEGNIPRENAPHLYFEVQDVDFEVSRMRHAGYEMEQEPKAQTWLWYEAWLRDPAGNRICIYHAADHRRYPPWRIDQLGAPSLHLVIRDGASFALVKHEGGEHAWRDLQARYGDYKSSLGPFDLFDVLSVLERDWPQLFLAHQSAIRAFVQSSDTELTL